MASAVLAQLRQGYAGSDDYFSMNTPNWLRFRAGERTHVVTGMSGPMHLTPCGYAAHGATGVPDKRAKKCRACSRAVRPVSPQERRMAGHRPE